MREENLKRIQGMAGTGAPGAAGTAARTSGPSASCAGRVQARVRPNIVFTDDIGGNPEGRGGSARLAPDGTIVEQAPEEIQRREAAGTKPSCALSTRPRCCRATRTAACPAQA